jgi:hypothetical protein
VAIVCMGEPVEDLRGKKLTYANVKASVLKSGRFSVFAATATDKHARIFTALCRDPELVTDNSCGFPWTKVSLRTP